MVNKKNQSPRKESELTKTLKRADSDLTKKKYKEAITLYQEATELKGATATPFYKLAKIYVDAAFDESIQLEEECKTSQEYVKQSLEYIENALSKGKISKEVQAGCQEILKKLIKKSEIDDLRPDIYYLLAKTDENNEENTINYFLNTLEAILHDSEKCDIKQVIEHINSRQTLNFPLKEVQTFCNFVESKVSAVESSVALDIGLRSLMVLLEGKIESPPVRSGPLDTFFPQSSSEPSQNITKQTTDKLIKLVNILCHNLAKQRPIKLKHCHKLLQLCNNDESCVNNKDRLLKTICEGIKESEEISLSNATVELQELVNYYKNNKQDEKAIEILENVLFRAEATDSKFRSLRKELEQFYKDSNDVEKLKTFKNRMRTGDVPELLYEQADNILIKLQGRALQEDDCENEVMEDVDISNDQSQPQALIKLKLNSVSDVNELKQAINLLRKAALKRHQPSMSCLQTFAQAKDPVPEAVIAWYDVLANVGEYSKNKTESPFGYNKKTVFNSVTRDIRDAYETAFKQNRPGVFAEFAMLRQTGMIFEKNEFLARALFENAAKNEAEWQQLLVTDSSNFPSYLPNTTGDTETSISRTERKSLDDSMNASLKCPIGNYLVLLYASQCFDGDGGEMAIEQAKKIYEAILPKLTPNKRNAIYFYQLADCYFNDFFEAQSQNDEELMGYFAELAAKNYKTAADLNYKNAALSLKILLECYPMDEYQDVLAAYDIDTDQTVHSESLPMDDDDVETLNFSDAKISLDAGNPLPMRRIAESWFGVGSNEYQEAIDALTEYYKNKAHGILMAVTSLCYESMRHDFEKSPVCGVLHDVLQQLNPDFENNKLNTYREFLTEQEKQANDYFDEYCSDDSDDDAQINHARNDGSMTRSSSSPEKSIRKLDKQAKKMLTFIENLSKKPFDDTEYQKMLDKIKSLFINCADTAVESQSDNKSSRQVRIDLETLNYYAARGGIKPALQQISTKFVVAQLRGLHFNTKMWNQPSRLKYRKRARSSLHPLLEKIICSAAVHQHANVDKFDITEESLLKLEKSARFIYLRMLQLPTQPMHKLDDLPPELQKLPVFKSRQYENRSHQVQEYYTFDYDGFHNLYLSQAAKDNEIFTNRENPFVSTGDIQSTHPARYAYGNKLYKNHQAERLGQHYSSIGKNKRPHSGSVLLLLHPITDFSRQDFNSINALNSNGKIFVPKHIVAERETSFYAMVRNDRLRYIHLAKYPSFHREYHGCKDVMFRKYGLTAIIYNAFKEAFSNEFCGANTHNRTLLTILLGQYLSAFHTIELNVRAAHLAKGEMSVLIYRTKDGCYSLSPTTNISPTPNGDNDSSRLKRMFTQQLRKFGVFKNEPMDDTFEEFDAELSTDSDDNMEISETLTRKRSHTSTPNDGRIKGNKLRKFDGEFSDDVMSDEESDNDKIQTTPTKYLG